jgi:hypothetical protein
MADDFEPVRAAAFGGDGVLNRASDDFENCVSSFIQSDFASRN